MDASMTSVFVCILTECRQTRHFSSSLPSFHHLVILLANCQKLSSRSVLNKSNQLRKARRRSSCMLFFYYPMTSSKYIHRCSSEKCLKIQLFLPNIT